MEMGWERTIKPIAVAVTDRLLRGYIRYSPGQAGKRHAWKLYEQRFGWRTERKVADTPFGFKVHVQMPDHIQKVIWLTGRWEPVISRFFRSILAPGDTFVDVGANIGYYSLLAARVVGQRGCVYSIEGSPSIFPLLRENIALNHAANVEAINAIVGDRDGEQEFWLASVNNRGLSTAVETVGRSKHMRSEGRVSCRTLTSLVPTERLLNARLIKIDVEGSERAVLEPLLQRLGEFSHRTIWTVELSPHLCQGGQAEVDRLFAAFGRQGYVAAAIRNDYSLHMYLSKPRSVQLQRITAAPPEQADVVFFRE
jgi:FkbM family methyltransferase